MYDGFTTQQLQLVEKYQVDIKRVLKREMQVEMEALPFAINLY
jgi:hypothetical protein